MDPDVIQPSPSVPPRSPSVPPGLAAGMIVAGKYELVRKIGSGAMGEVWAARHETLDEEVAIKLVMRGVDHEDGTSAESRFLLEARVAAALSRKTRHIVAVTDHGQDGALGYLVMELLAGESLDQRLARTGALPLEKVAPMITQIARGLSIAHGEGVVHRDLKPSNVFVTLDEEGNAVAKVLDFGIAKLRRNQRKATHATQRGFLLGTPAYMSPEQARGKQLDHRADVWALAVIAYHMLTNEFPFDGASGEDLFARLIRIEPIAIRDRMPDLPQIVGDFFERAFATRIEDRFQSALALAGAFEQLAPMSAGMKLSLPPPPALSMLDECFDTAGLEEGSLFVAGVPRRYWLAKSIAAGVFVFALLVGTSVLLSVYFEREPMRTATTGPTGLSAGATTLPLPAPPSVPAPEAPAEPPSGPTVISTDDLPAAVVAPRAVRPAPRAEPASTSNAPSSSPEAAGENPTAAAVRRARSVDKSEVF
ncbi:MAG: eukaryotic-like serine/threonine-protein kinase [Myxococcales bacterium]|nr:eukaryotic-like serine/threonine-protein kinase [Myxococcales bacterium]